MPYILLIYAQFEQQLYLYPDIFRLQSIATGIRFAPLNMAGCEKNVQKTIPIDQRYECVWSSDYGSVIVYFGAGM